MSRRSFSLPDDLDRKLERYAQEHNQPISQIVQNALEQYLEGLRPPAPPIPPAPGLPELPAVSLDQFRQVQDYIGGLAGYVDALRQFMSQQSLPWAQPPQPFPPPPWWAR